ncbi:MAG: hypothetical protein N2749_02015 [Clostridia bacterium]|nr:hypothetical protein [Clostridia bacterium]
MQYKGLITIKRLDRQDMLVIPLEIVEVDDIVYNKLLSQDNDVLETVKFEVRFERGNDKELRGYVSIV